MAQAPETNARFSRRGADFPVGKADRSFQGTTPMTLIELFILALGLSMDAFAVAVCKGLAAQKLTPGRAVLVGAWFGLFQAVMPLIGWLLGSAFSRYITAFDHWIAFGLLALIGLGMIREAREGEKAEDASLAFGKMLVLSLATSVDALAVGVTFAFLNVSIVPAVCFIGAVTFCVSAVGVWVGGVFGARFRGKAEIAGGVILILLGIKILLEHLGVIRF